MILKFVDREEELKGLNQAYQADTPQFFVVYGRRRIGKTELIKRFCEDKTSFYFLARKQDIKLEIERFRERFSKKYDVYLEKTDEWKDLFQQIMEKLPTEDKTVLAIDEFPYWIEEYKAILSEFQHVWDEGLKGENVFLILTGSSIGMMETQVLGYKSPLYGRRTGQLKLKELPLHSIQELLPTYPLPDIFRTYGAVGSIPFYLQEFHPEKTFWENIRNTFLNKLNILHEEARILLREELRKPNTYFNIVKAILDGATTLSEISSQSRVNITNLNKYLQVLQTLDIIGREYPVTQPPKKRNFLYTIKDNFFRFWLTYLYPHMEQVEENPDTVLAHIKKDYPSYMGPVFEQICRKMIQKTGYTPVGRWWHKEKEVDVVALNKPQNKILLGECKWSKTPVNLQVLRNLEQKATHITWRKKKREEVYALFSKSGFTKRIKKLQRKNLLLFDLKQLQKLIHRRHQ